MAWCYNYTIGTVLAGWYAYNTVPHTALSHAAMTDHRNWALSTAHGKCVTYVSGINCYLSNKNVPEMAPKYARSIRK